MTTLREEITNDPLGIGYAAMNDVELESSLNSKIYSVVGKLPIDEFIGVLYDTGVFDALFDAAEAGSAEMAKEIKRLQTLKSFGINNIDMANPAVVGRLTATGIPQAIVEVLVSKATVVKSRADVLECSALDSDIIQAKE
jgi:hypothetical protein